MAEDVLPGLLGALASPDNIERKQAEATLEEFIGRQGFFPTLLERLRSGQFTQSQQLTGIAIIKNLQHRMPGQDTLSALNHLCAVLENGEALCTATQHRAAAPLWGSAAAKLMCRVMSSTPDAIAPVQEHLFKLLNSVQATVMGVMCCRELTVELPPESQAQFFEPLLASLVAIALPDAIVDSPPSTVFSSLTGSSLHVLAEIMDHQQQSKGDSSVLALFQGSRMATCLFVASFPLSPSDDVHNQCITEALRLVLHILDASHASALASPQFFLSIMQSIEVDMETLRAVCADTETTISRAMALRWETFSRVLKKKKSAPAVVRLFKGMLEPVFQLILETCVLSDHVLSLWEEDVNAFLKMESERRDEISWTPRDVAVDCASLMLKRFGAAWMGVVLQHGGNILKAPLDGTDAQWRLRESLLFILGYFLETTELGVLEGLGAQGFAQSLVEAVLAVDLAAGAPLALSARALVLLDAILKHERNNDSRQHWCTQVLMPCIYTLDGPLTMVTAVAVTLLRRVLKHTSSGSIESGAGERALSSLLRCLASPQLADDVLYIFVEATLAILKRGQALGITHGGWSAAVPQLMEVWRSHLRDPNIGELVTDALALVIRQQCADNAIAHQLMWLRDVMCCHGSIEMLCVIPYVVRFVKVVMEHASMELVNETATALLEPLCQLLLTNDDSSIAAGAAECLGAVLYRAGGGLHHMSVVVTKSLVYLGEVDTPPSHSGREPSSEWMLHRPPTPPLRSLASPAQPDPRLSPMPLLDEPPQAVPLSDVLIAIVGSLLREDRSEISLLHIGAYLGAVASCAPRFSETQITRFLKAVIRRLIVDPVQSKTATAELLLPFAILMDTYPSALVSALSNLSCLGPVLERWLCVLPALAEATTGMQTLVRSLSALVRIIEESAISSSSRSLDQETLTTLGECIVLWKDGRRAGGGSERGVPLPFCSAAFIAVAKVACVVISRPVEFIAECEVDDAAVESDSACSGDASDDEEDGEEDVAEKHHAHEVNTSAAEEMRHNSSSHAVPPPFRESLHRMVALASHYTGSTQMCFTAGETECLTWFASTSITVPSC